jgi:small subunit ribosomal protein S19
MSDEIKLTRAKRIPFVDKNLYDRVKFLVDNNKKQSMIKTYSRRCTIIPMFIGYTIHVHNGKGFVPVAITEGHVGYKLGEFSPTRKYTYKAPDKKQGVKKK